MDYGNDSDDEPMSTEMLEGIHDGGQYHLSLNSRQARYKISYCIKRSQQECKEVLLSTHNMGKGLHKVFKAVKNDILQVLPIFGDSGSTG